MRSQILFNLKNIMPMFQSACLQKIHENITPSLYFGTSNSLSSTLGYSINNCPLTLVNLYSSTQSPDLYVVIFLFFIIEIDSNLAKNSLKASSGVCIWHFWIVPFHWKEQPLALIVHYLYCVLCLFKGLDLLSRCHFFFFFF